MCELLRFAQDDSDMRTFGGFKTDDAWVYGELRGDQVHVLKKPFWLGLEFDDAPNSVRL